MKTCCFSLITDTPLVEMEDFEQICVQLEEAECDDARIHSVNDKLVLDFERQAESMAAAIVAVRQALAQTPGIQIVDTVMVSEA
ncbi:hypothetical protein NFHSH190041_30650 [Shewanella sp. NFH-SH190041]|uniref:hypothetical protein n=1 Tax=Shewanella sp. NFH-SH190041 TaxID=2950245 RepID=UPI0021C453D5|nr:hypothetical protein [Shewanella sp. NFH-SH190041]BDM65613.1 hypothetical protein NFHSH190041_30650 [Shewanella sp. NFH-SH190041]